MAGADLPRTVGPYRLEGLLGKGGMGEVYSAYDRRLDRRVAIKHIRPEAAGNPANRARFRREAWVAARLNHPALVQIFDILEEDDGDWIVMELIDGPSLAEKLSGGPLELDAIFSLGGAVAEGLAEAHEKDIVHRDLKAENVMLSASGHAKLLDFGLAKPLFESELDVAISGRGEVVGTGRSMSPEQARGFPVDARSDLFSLGTLLYEMSTGESPFLGETALDTLSRVSSHQQLPARELNPSLPRDLSDLIDRLLEKAPELRPGSAREVAEALNHIADSRGHGADLPASPQSDGLLLDQETQILPATSSLSGARTGAVIRTLLLTDLVDSTALFARLGDRRTAELSERHDALARDLLAEHCGREIDKSDGFLLLFERPVDAVAYALAYHRALARLSREIGYELAARAGIHLGEVFLRENTPEAIARGAKPLEVEGLAKATAARVMSLALGHQTLMTHGAFDLARRGAVGELDADGLSWLDHGAYSLKGVDEPVDVYEVGIEGFSPLVNPVNRTKAIRVAEPRLAPAASSGAPPKPGAETAGRRWRLVALAAAGVVILAVLGVFALRRGGDPPSGAEPPASPAVGGAGETPEQQPYELYEQGMAYLKRYDREGNLEKAIASFQRILARNESSAPAHAGLARAYWHKYNAKSRDRQLLEQGLTIARRAVDLDEHLASARVSLGLILTSLGQPEEARQELEHALELEPSNAEAYWGLSLMYESRDELQAAEAAYGEATELDPSNWLIFDYLGAFYFQSDRYEEAEKAFLRSIELAPDFVSAYRNLAGIYFLQGRESEAASLLQKAITIRPDPSIYANLGTILFYQGLYQQAASTFEKAMALGGSASNQYFMWGNLGDAYRWTPDGRDRAREAYQRAIQLLREEMESSPENPGLHSRLALYLAKLGDAGQAREALSELDTMANLKAYDWYRVAVARELLGERIDALEALEQALRAGFSQDEIRRDPELLDLRSDPGYHRLLLALASESES